MKKSLYAQMFDAGWRCINGAWANPKEVLSMSNQHEEINSAIEYWSRNIDSCCEAGSARDFLAINDLKLFMDEIKRLREEVSQLNFLIQEASEEL